MEENGPATVLFEGVVFTVIPSNEFNEDGTDEVLDEVQDALEKDGGEFLPLREVDQRIESLESLTFIISTHVDFQEYNQAVELGIHVVKPSWVVESAGKQRQASPRQHTPDPSQFFQDVVLSCANLPPGDTEAIAAGVIALGGQHSGPLTKLVTHIATTDPDHEKCRLAGSKGLRCKIVLPHWFDDCLRLGKKISENPYMFPDPELLGRNSNHAVQINNSPQLKGAITAIPSGTPSFRLPPSPSKSRKNLNALMSKNIFICDDLQIEDRLHKTLEGLINHSGGLVTDNVDDSDIYVGHFRDGSEYVAASQAGKVVANLSWLYHVINRNRYTDPLSKLLHYPVPRDGLPGFQNMKICISNYSGAARIYLENLIKHCGAEYTKVMKMDNTHLITAHKQSEKCDAAQEWNINMVNHLWLEESYAKCAVQTLTNPKYTHFPARTNLGEIAGQTRLDVNRLEKMFFPRPRLSPQKLQFQQRPSQSKTASSSNTRVLDGSPTPAARQLSEEPPKLVIKHPDVEIEAEPVTAKKPRGRPPKAPATPRGGDDEKENQSPAITSMGRSSKAKALESLHKQAGDIALFQKELKRKGGVTHGGRRSSHEADLSSPAPVGRTSRKRSSEEFEATNGDLSDDEAQSQILKSTKKTKQSNSPAVLPPIQYRVMVTGYDRWHGNMNKESADKQKLRQLGVLLTTDPKDVNVLVAPKILRTKKFVAALACAPTVVDTSYLDTALADNELIEYPSLLDDSEYEERNNFSLAESLERAKINQGKLFRGWTVFVTKDVNGGFDTYKDIVSLNGGSAMMYAGRTGVILPRRRLENDPDAGAESQHQGGRDEFDFVYLVSGTSDKEMKHWKTFRELAKKQDLQPRIVSTDWLLTAAMRQEITWNAEWEWEETSS